MKECIIKQSDKVPEQSALHFPPEHLLITPEFRLVAACSWVPKSGHLLLQNQIIESLSSCERNWDDVASLVLKHDVVGQFCTVMGKRGWVNVPTETRGRLKNSRAQQAVRALGQVAELKRLGRLFAEANIPLIPLKGVALSQELYGDPCVRSSCDLDILVKPEDVEKAEELLIQTEYHCALGFHGMKKRQKRHIINTLYHHEYINDVRGVHVELHWSCFSWPREQVAVLWDTSGSSTWLDVGLMQLSREENILILADHGAHHGWPCLKWLSDIAMLMKDMPEATWRALYDMAAFFDLQRVICQTAVLLEWFYGIKPPQEFKELLASDAAAQKLLVYAASQLLASGEDVAFKGKKFDALRQTLWIKQLKPSTPLFPLLGRVMIIPADFVELPLPDYLFWLYLPLRPYFWFKRHYLKKSKC